MNDSPTLLTAPQAAKRLGVSAEAIRRWVREGQMAAIKLPSGGLRFREEDIEALLEPTPTKAS